MLVRPSYVLGGRAMVIAYDEDMIRRYMQEAVTFSQDRPVLIDRFLEDAVEVDVDALCDGEDVLIAGIMEAYRRGRRALGRQLVRAAGHVAQAGDAAHDRGLHHEARACPQRDRPDERAVCRAERHRVRARSQPARLPHHPLRQQGDGHRAPQGGGGPDARQEAQGHPRTHGRPFVRPCSRCRSSS